MRFEKCEMERLRCSSLRSELGLLALKPLGNKFQRPTVLSDGPHDIVWSTGRNLGLDLKRHGDGRTDQADQMRDDLLRDPAGITAHARRVKRDRAVEPFRLRGDGRF